jgi:hypothetical protein
VDDGNVDDCPLEIGALEDGTLEDGGLEDESVLEEGELEDGILKDAVLELKDGALVVVELVVGALGEPVAEALIVRELLVGVIVIGALEDGALVVCELVAGKLVLEAIGDGAEDEEEDDGVPDGLEEELRKELAGVEVAGEVAGVGEGELDDCTLDRAEVEEGEVNGLDNVPGEEAVGELLVQRLSVQRETLGCYCRRYYLYQVQRKTEFPSWRLQKYKPDWCSRCYFLEQK